MILNFHIQFLICNLFVQILQYMMHKDFCFEISAKTKRAIFKVVAILLILITINMIHFSYSILELFRQQPYIEEK